MAEERSKVSAYFAYLGAAAQRARSADPDGTLWAVLDSLANLVLKLGRDLVLLGKAVSLDIEAEELRADLPAASVTLAQIRIHFDLHRSSPSVAAGTLHLAGGERSLTTSWVLLRLVVKRCGSASERAARVVRGEEGRAGSPAAVGKDH
jgi:hypothetical protein